jgi:hypothetical protein
VTSNSFVMLAPLNDQSILPLLYIILITKAI